MVPLHQLGTAMSVQNLVRQLGGAMLVTAFGALMISGLGLAPGANIAPGDRGSLDGIDVLSAFRHFFIALALVFGVALYFLIRMDIKPLRGGNDRS
jgi:hypothetical protein